MRRHHLIAYAGLLCCALICVRGRAEEAPVEAKTLMGKWLEAKQLGDAKMIAYYLADDFLGVGPRGQAMDKREFVAAMSDKKLNVKDVDSSEQSIAFHGSFAVSSGVHRMTGQLEGQDVSGNYRYVEVLKKSGNGWVVVASTLTQIREPSTQPTTAPAR